MSFLSVILSRENGVRKINANLMRYVVSIAYQNLSDSLPLEANLRLQNEV